MAKPIPWPLFGRGSKIQFENYFLILGERRWTVLLILPIAFSAVFFLVMTKGLGLYLATGTWILG